MKPILIALLLLNCILVTNLSAQEAQPAAAGMSAERLGRIDAVVQDYVNKQWLNGAVIIVYRNNQLAYYKAIGYDDATKKTAMKKDEIFRIASQTKAITSTAIMMLFEEGKLLLDDAVSKYIPEFKKQGVLDKFNEADSSYTTVPAKREITIRDLLTHTSGIGYAQIGSKQMNAIYAKAGVVAGIGVGKILLADKMKILGKLPLFHQPGEKFTYGLNTDLLGYLVEVVSGMPLDKFLSSHIFEPLGMKDTYFFLPKEKHSRLVTLYTTDSTEHAVKMADVISINGSFNGDYPNTDGTYFSGGGGLSSTAYDYALFMRMLVNGGSLNGKKILSRTAVRMMTSNQIGDLELSHGDKFGLGFELVTEASSAFTPASAGSFSWGGMFSSNYWMDPKEKIVCQIFLNIYPNPHGDIHNKIKALVYQAINN
ncbi:MAG: serine hydrolase domain-containing protein [Chitinophagaceae bacterium]